MQCNLDYNQFAGMKIPDDIKPKDVFTRTQIEEMVNKGRKGQKVDVHKDLIINLNSASFRPNEVHIHTADISGNYTPDFDFVDYDEFDAWRKTCKLKYNLQQFERVDMVRSENFFHKMQICEALTLFEEVHRMLKPNAGFVVTVLNLDKIVDEIHQTNPKHVNRYYELERLLYSQTDSTGQYYNQTIWSYDRLETYLKMSRFDRVETNEKNKDPHSLSVIAYKQAEEIKEKEE